MNLFALLDQAAQRFPDQGAVYHGQRRCWTWSELRQRSLRPAGSIRRDHPAGARIAIASENRPEIVELLFGIWAAECVEVPINYKLHPRYSARFDCADYETADDAVLGSVGRHRCRGAASRRHTGLGG